MKKLFLIGGNALIAVIVFSFVLIPDAFAACYVNGKEVSCGEALQEARRVLGFVQKLLELIFRFVGGS